MSKEKTNSTVKLTTNNNQFNYNVIKGNANKNRISNRKVLKYPSISYSFTSQDCSELIVGDIFELAKAFLLIESMTHKKLQKLCYYAKAWYLALYDENIIKEQFEAWVHGAVQPRLYEKYKNYGFEKINVYIDEKDVPESFSFFAKEIFNAYGHLSGDELEAINHTEEPWIKARGNCKPWERCNNTIKEQDMKNFYRNMI